MIKVILNDGTEISDKIKSVNKTYMTVKNNNTTTDSIVIFFNVTVTDETLELFTTDTCEKITIIDDISDSKLVYSGYNNRISIGKTISNSDAERVCTVTLEK